MVEMVINEGAFPNSPFNGEKAFETFFKQNFAALCVYCQYRFDFSVDVSKEIVHTAFIKLWQSRETLSSDLSVKSYLYKIITNSSLDVIRSEKTRKKYHQDLERSAAENTAIGFDLMDTKELSERIDAAIAALPPQMRKIFELSRYEGLKYADIAALLGISVKTVETQMSRALAKLRSSLSDYLYFVAVLLLPWR